MTKRCGQRYIIAIYTIFILQSLNADAHQINPVGANDAVNPPVSGPVISNGRVVIDNASVEYESHAGTIELSKKDPEQTSTEIFYVAYFKKTKDKNIIRPITFIYNGGPGSSTIWLHMGALGPKRVLTSRPGEPKLATYIMTDNKHSLLDISDLVFIDAPGTGYSTFSSHAQTYQERSDQKMMAASEVYSLKGDAKAFKQFIMQFLTQYQRWGSPKYLFGESYGTTRSVLLAEELLNNNVELKGMIMVSPYMNYSNNADDPELNPGYDLPYVLSLPSFTAAAWYHKKLQHPFKNLNTALDESESFARGEYAQALLAGARLNKDQRVEIARRLFQFTGIPEGEWIRNNLRLNGPVFAAKLLNDNRQIVGRMDARYAGPAETGQVLAAGYDPSVNVMSSPYLAAFHDYAASELNYLSEKEYRVFTDAIHYWNMSGDHNNRAFNVIPNLSRVMKSIPDMKVLFISGVYDLALPYSGAMYDINHLTLPENIRKNISFVKYDTGHMPYIDEASLKKMRNDLKLFFKKK